MVGMAPRQSWGPEPGPILAGCTDCPLRDPGGSGGAAEWLDVPFVHECGCSICRLCRACLQRTRPVPPYGASCRILVVLAGGEYDRRTTLHFPTSSCDGGALRGLLDQRCCLASPLASPGTTTSMNTFRRGLVVGKFAPLH